MSSPEPRPLRLVGNTAQLAGVFPTLAGVAAVLTLSCAGVVGSLSGPVELWLFPGLGAVGTALLVYKAITSHLHARKFGSSHIDLTAIPEVGAPLSGVADLGVEVPPDAVVTLTVTCKKVVGRTHHTKNGPKKRAVTEVAWQGTADIAEGSTVPLGDRVQIPFSVPLPRDASPTRPPQEGLRIGAVDWTIEIAIALPGLDYYDTFDLDVRPPGAP